MISSAGVSLVRTGSVGDQIASSAQSSVGKTDHLEKIELQDFNTTKILYIISPKWNFDKNQLIYKNTCTQYNHTDLGVLMKSVCLSLDALSLGCTLSSHSRPNSTSSASFTRSQIWRILLSQRICDHVTYNRFLNKPHHLKLGKVL